MTTKVFLKALRPPVSAAREIVHRRKRGLSVPSDAGSVVRCAFLGCGCPFPAICQPVGVDPSAAREVFQNIWIADYARALWTLIVLSHWYQQTRPPG